MLNLFDMQTEKHKGIFNPLGGAFSCRFNCQVGAVMVGDTSHRGNKLAFTLLGVERLFGSLGMQAKPIPWLRIYFIATPDNTTLPPNTVCCALLKTAGMANLEGLITEIIASGQGAADKVFELSFERKTSEVGNYYVPVTTIRDRSGEAEKKQLELIKQFMATQPRLQSGDAPSLFNIEGLSQEELQLLAGSAQSVVESTALTAKK
jgi:hypothetical protein